MAKEIVSFEHFDPDVELGVIDATGQPIRPRKKPGRKPNPPSPAQRKAQNRAAQRAFRERKRYEMREAQLTAKKSLHSRNQALVQIKILKRRIEELEYETNYLKGYTLTLKLACVANRVEVPKYWDSGCTDELGCDEITFSKTKGIPQQFEFFLDKDMNIINLDQLQQNKDSEIPPNIVLSPPSSTYLDTTALEQQEDIEMNESIFQNVLERKENIVCTTDNANKISEEQESTEEATDEKIIDPKTGVVRSITECQEDCKHSTENHEKKIFPPMPAFEAVKIMRELKNLGTDARVVYTPTELQRHIRHDPRIDSLPGPAFRDHLILFQDYYNADDFFGYIQDHCIFLGGELGNVDSWFLPPEFFKKYWFLCSTHRRERIDNAVEIIAFVNQKMLEFLTTRKQMYIDREQYPEYFPIPTKQEQQEIDDAFLEKDDQQILCDMLLEHDPEPTTKQENEEQDTSEPIMQPLKLIPSNMPLSKYQQTIDFC